MLACLHLEADLYQIDDSCRVPFRAVLVTQERQLVWHVNRGVHYVNKGQAVPSVAEGPPWQEYIAQLPKARFACVRLAAGGLAGAMHHRRKHQGMLGVRRPLIGET